jgi:predicted ATPase
LRIAITGAVGVGKTTLALALSKKMGVPLIQENFREVVQAFNPDKSSKSNNLSQDILLKNCRQACMRWLQDRLQLQEKMPSFVQDRCAIDILQRWLLFNLSGQNNADISRFIKHCQDSLACLDWIIIPPFNLYQGQENEDRLLRNSSLSVIFRGHGLILGLAHMLVRRDKVLFLPSELLTVQARVDFITARICQAKE